jgi:hypothetical protein
MRKISAAAVFALGFLSLSGHSAAAAGVIYDCTMTNREFGKGWISEQVRVILPAQGQPQAYDTMIRRFAKEPIAARVRKNGSKIIARWTLKNIRDNQNQNIVRFDYVARIDTQTMGIHLSAKPAGYTNRLTGTGICKARRA